MISKNKSNLFLTSIIALCASLQINQLHGMNCSADTKRRVDQNGQFLDWTPSPEVQVEEQDKVVAKQAKPRPVFDETFACTGLPLVTQSLVKEYLVDPQDYLKAITHKHLTVDRMHRATVAFLFPNAQIVTGSYYDHIARIWDPLTGKCLHELKGHNGYVTVVTVVDDRVITGASDGTMRVWDSVSGLCLKEVKAHAKALHTIENDYDGHVITAAYGDNVARIYDTATWECVREVVAQKPIHSMVAMGPLMFINTIDKVIEINLVVSDNGINVQFAGDIMSTQAGDKKVQKNIDFEDENMPLPQFFKDFLGFKNVTFMKDFFIPGQGAMIAIGFQDGTILLWKASGEVQLLCTLTGHTASIISLAVQQNSNITTYSCDNTVRRWDVATGECGETINMLPGDYCSELVLRGPRAQTIVNQYEDGAVLLISEGKKNFVINDSSLQGFGSCECSTGSRLIDYYQKDETALAALQNLSCAMLEQLNFLIARLDQRWAKLLDAGSQEPLALEGDDAKFYRALPDSIQKCLASQYNNKIIIQ
jgi:hypothetical protein